ncbi:MAG: sigma 54-interacting transcriptional regulator [Deltaproteobacteria bacterium]|nr:sigma 54-interacting transcriptional regulator [Deltaproteobacteria bacterium]
MNGQDNTLKQAEDAHLNAALPACGKETAANVSDVHKCLGINSEMILDSIADGVVVIGLDHKVLLVNRAAKEIMGAAGAGDLLIGSRCSSVLGHTGCTFGCLVNTTIKTGEHLYNYEADFENNGRKLRLSINTALLKDRDGKVIGGIEIFRDISLLKELKDELKGRYSFENIIGKNWKVHEVFELLKEVAPTKAAVLIEGETGTGKELIANAIHHKSPRAGGPFVKVNCAALSEGLLESELFGHVKGAFTGAVSDRAGRFEMADNGTLFLDEVGDISPHTQVKLLRALQEGEFERVGGTKTIKINVRVITATNKDLKAEVKKGAFREDLYYRLKVVPIRLPALRQRKDDIPLLVKYFMEKFNVAMGMEVTNISPLAMERLMEYNFPGNIRELEHAIEHAFVRCQGKTINPEHLPKDLQTSDIISKAVNDAEPLKSLEREMIIRTLGDTRWKFTECARKLRISRTTLWRRMKDLRIEKPAR